MKADGLSPKRDGPFLFYMKGLMTYCYLYLSSLSHEEEGRRHRL
nr:MAG TPA: hypothetical protein [Caudoviricetes sp.]